MTDPPSDTESASKPAPEVPGGKRTLRRRLRWFALGFVGAVLVGGGWNVYRALNPSGSKEEETDVSIVGLDSSGKTKQPELAKDEHPLDPALRVARNLLEHIQQNVDDYTAITFKRERIHGSLTAEEKLFCKIRNRKLKEGKQVVPLSVYLRFQQPEDKNGQEVIWIEGKNDGKLIAHTTGALGLVRFPLAPTGPIAMAGNRYPITDIGIENLVVKLIERGEKERKLDGCEVEFIEGVELNGRACTVIEVRHPEQKSEFDFYLAQFFIDDELNVPLRYAAYTWPIEEGGEPVLEEEYTYRDLKLNVGLTDADFDPDNPDYDYP